MAAEVAGVAAQRIVSLLDYGEIRFSLYAKTRPLASHFERCGRLAIQLFFELLLERLGPVASFEFKLCFLELFRRVGSNSEDMDAMTRAAPTDEQLVKEYQEGGSSSVLNELLLRHATRLLAFIRHMGIRPADVDDVAQEVFLRVYRGLAGFDGRARFTTWLYRIVLNTTLTFLTRQAKVAQREKPSESSGDRLAITDDAILCRELESEISAALVSLSSPLRAALVLTSLHGFRIEEAAKIEGCSVSTLYLRLDEARKLMRTRLMRYLQP